MVHLQGPLFILNKTAENLILTIKSLTHISSVSSKMWDTYLMALFWSKVQETDAKPSCVKTRVNYLNRQLWEVSKISKHSLWTWMMDKHREYNINSNNLRNLTSKEMTNPTVNIKTTISHQWMGYLLYIIKSHPVTSILLFGSSSRICTCSMEIMLGKHGDSSGWCCTPRLH